MGTVHKFCSHIPHYGYSIRCFKYTSKCHVVMNDVGHPGPQSVSPGLEWQAEVEKIHLPDASAPRLALKYNGPTIPASGLQLKI